jgi:hypothetical protein
MVLVGDGWKKTESDFQKLRKEGMAHADARRKLELFFEKRVREVYGPSQAELEELHYRAHRSGLVIGSREFIDKWNRLNRYFRHRVAVYVQLLFMYHRQFEVSLKALGKTNISGICKDMIWDYFEHGGGKD